MQGRLRWQAQRGKEAQGAASALAQVPHSWPTGSPTTLPGGQQGSTQSKHSLLKVWQASSRGQHRLASESCLLPAHKSHLLAAPRARGQVAAWGQEAQPSSTASLVLRGSKSESQGEVLGLHKEPEP